MRIFRAAAKSVKQISRSKYLGITIVLAFMLVAFSIAIPRFFSIDNMLNVGRQIANTSIMAFGLALVLISGNIDLSIGSTYGLSATVTALMLLATKNTVISLLAGLSVGCIIGIVNGFFVVRVKMPSFVASFGMMYIARGIALIITLGYPIPLLVKGVNPTTNPVFFFLSQGKLFSRIPMQFVVMLVVMLIAYFLLHRTRFGVHVFACGNSDRAAFAAGINVSSVRFRTFILSGLTASIAGILTLSFIGSIQPVAGQGLEFAVFAAVIIGGTPMSGGDGHVVGIVMGALIIGILQNGLVLIGVGPFWQQAIIGIITLGAVSYDSITLPKRIERREDE